MTAQPTAALLPDGNRLHLHHGPIDLVIEAWGRDRAHAYGAAATRFETVLEELMDEHPALRQPVPGPALAGPVARRMAKAVAPFQSHFVTPMAAVAGAVADEILATLTNGHALDKAYVNNGGDIAFHLRAGQNLVVASPAGAITIGAQDGAKGLASSGWRGRSHSLGIADTVTVLARDAARADAAATLIANAVDLPNHPAIKRQAAQDIEVFPELGDLNVTVAVGPLSARDVTQALSRGAKRASAFRASGRIIAAALTLQNETIYVGERWDGTVPGPKDAIDHRRGAA